MSHTKGKADAKNPEENCALNVLEIEVVLEQVRWEESGSRGEGQFM